MKRIMAAPLAIPAVLALVAPAHAWEMTGQVDIGCANAVGTVLTAHPSIGRAYLKITVDGVVRRVPFGERTPLLVPNPVPVDGLPHTAEVILFDNDGDLVPGARVKKTLTCSPDAPTPVPPAPAPAPPVVVVNVTQVQIQEQTQVQAPPVKPTHTLDVDVPDELVVCIDARYKIIGPRTTPRTGTATWRVQGSKPRGIVWRLDGQVRGRGRSITIPVNKLARPGQKLYGPFLLTATLKNNCGGRRVLKVKGFNQDGPGDVA